MPCMVGRRVQVPEGSQRASAECASVHSTNIFYWRLDRCDVDFCGKVTLGGRHTTAEKCVSHLQAAHVQRSQGQHVALDRLEGLEGLGVQLKGVDLQSVSCIMIVTVDLATIARLTRRVMSNQRSGHGGGRDISEGLLDSTAGRER